MAVPKVQNRNRAHAVQQLKKFLKAEDPIDAERQLEAAKLNALVYIGDSLERLSEAFGNRDESHQVDLEEEEIVG